MSVRLLPLLLSFILMNSFIPTAWAEPQQAPSSSDWTQGWNVVYPDEYKKGTKKKTLSPTLTPLTYVADQTNRVTISLLTGFQGSEGKPYAQKSFSLKRYAGRITVVFDLVHQGPWSGDDITVFINDTQVLKNKYAYYDLNPPAQNKYEKLIGKGRVENSPYTVGQYRIVIPFRVDTAANSLVLLDETNQDTNVTIPLTQPEQGSKSERSFLLGTGSTISPQESQKTYGIGKFKLVQTLAPSPEWEEAMPQINITVVPVPYPMPMNGYPQEKEPLKKDDKKKNTPQKFLRGERGLRKQLSSVLDISS